MLKEKGLLALGILITVLFVIYGMFKAFPYVKGPEVIITSPRDGDHVGTSTFKLTGKAIRARELYLSGKSVTVDLEGNFSETFVSYAPYTILTIEAVDRHNKRSLQTLTVTP
jgi:bacillopeptidase F